MSAGNRIIKATKTPQEVWQQYKDLHLNSVIVVHCVLAYNAADYFGCHWMKFEMLEISTLCKARQYTAFTTIENVAIANALQLKAAQHLFSPEVLTLTRWPSYTNSTPRRWRYTACENKNFQKLSSDKHVDIKSKVKKVNLYSAL